MQINSTLGVFDRSNQFFFDVNSLVFL